MTTILFQFVFSSKCTQIPTPPRPGFKTFSDAVFGTGSDN